MLEVLKRKCVCRCVVDARAHSGNGRVRFEHGKELHAAARRVPKPARAVADFREVGKYLELDLSDLLTPQDGRITVACDICGGWAHNVVHVRGAAVPRKKLLCCDDPEYKCDGTGHPVSSVAIVCGWHCNVDSVLTYFRKKWERRAA